MSPNDISVLIRQKNMGHLIARYVSHIPHMHLDAVVQPITRSVLRIKLCILFAVNPLLVFLSLFFMH